MEGQQDHVCSLNNNTFQKMDGVEIVGECSVGAVPMHLFPMIGLAVEYYFRSLMIYALTEATSFYFPLAQNMQLSEKIDLTALLASSRFRL